MCHKTGHSYSMDKLLILFWFEQLISLEYNDNTLTRQVSSPSPEVELKQEVIQSAIQNVNGAVDEEEKGASSMTSCSYTSSIAGTLSNSIDAYNEKQT